MEFEKEYLCLEQTDCVYSKIIDCEEEYQESLPQYCDDVIKIIKCTSNNIVTSTNINDSEIKIYGKSYITLTYVNENNEIAYSDFENEFVKTINNNNISKSSFITTNITDKYNNYRLINQRRIDIHNAFDIKICIFDKVTYPSLKSCENSKLKNNTIKCANVINNCVSKCEFDEELEIPSDSKPIKRIIGYSGFVTLNETKIIKDKALVKGNVSITVLYTQDCENNIVSKCIHNFDVSKIVDISGLLDTDNVITKLKLGNVFVKSKNSSDGCLNNIELIGDVCIDLTVIRENKISYVTDGYILNRKSKCTYQDFKSSNNCKKVNDKVQREYEIKLNSNITNVIDVGLNINDIILKNNECKVNVKTLVFYENVENEFCSVENNNEINIFKDEFDNGIANINICSFDYSIKDNNIIKVRMTLCYNAILYNEIKDKILSEIECTDDLVEYPALSVYFAKQNENVWNIAKKFSSDCQLIIKENDLKSDILDSNKVLIIPGI